MDWSVRIDVRIMKDQQACMTRSGTKDEKRFARASRPPTHARPMPRLPPVWTCQWMMERAGAHGNGNGSVSVRTDVEPFSAVFTVVISSTQTHNDEQLLSVNRFVRYNYQSIAEKEIAPGPKRYIRFRVERTRRGSRKEEGSRLPVSAWTSFRYEDLCCAS